ncbi:long-chain-fatty-acid--AMP ligase FadD32 [Mycobacteroides immunogenum]|uniref:Acyl-AMP synthetase n=1 Tax=Mycobacteroides immunogenum TaxID=83262 RepID=A0A0N1CAX8_9MYCO|nr:long-chain-fatty-acid--AMP ligase FadD32 [Mycobacteroides immunogenum]AMT69178.1 fatty-acid--CoA ligase [Mycobacteroides immunogenum]ANO02199.1 fatty-acid--CoA ligase [Mycobacteroides immunogenum]KIU40638.1 fatty-acid--CoA ligase [Mycobacteroides immunogenum]KPG11309.1 fatty-acid--CoA ligase [Mycobacteroides immunogenum]KPG12474.1 fatty-acid--CoA ligase [Mycobacteroides immunogenum]
MAFDNPFLDSAGHIKFPEDGSIVGHVEGFAQSQADSLAYRFLDFSTERDGEYIDITWSEFGARNRAVAARLQQVTKPGDRVAILAPQSLDYLVAHFGALYAGAISVPLFDPSEAGHAGRLHAVLDDCEPSAVLTTTDCAEGVRKFFRNRPPKERPRVIAVDAIPNDVGSTWVEPVANKDTIAYLQYTSGSTRAPAGVQITHLGLATNLLQLIDALSAKQGQGSHEDLRGTTWLPFFHDMGLITVMVPSMLGKHMTVMSPAAFIRRPLRWLREMGVKGDDRGGTFSALPNFAFEHCALRGVPKEGEPPLDLSNVYSIINGSEPVSTASLKKFCDAFEPYGFDPKAIHPSYGMAEATLFVSSTIWNTETARVLHVDRTELNAGRIVQVEPGSENSVTQVSSGKMARDEWAVIVDGETASEVPDGQIGEIWLHGNNIGSGYWGREEETRAAFHNTLKSRISESHAEGVADDADWLNTGDLGVWVDGELYITGRVKDLIIVDGRNHYPQDIEYTAQEANKALRPGYVAAFSVPANQLPQEVFDNPHAGLKYDPEDSSEQLVVIGERSVGGHKSDNHTVGDDVRAAVAVRHGVTVRDVLLVPAGSIARTSSGKIARRAARTSYLDGSLRGGYQQTAFPDDRR